MGNLLPPQPSHKEKKTIFFKLPKRLIHVVRLPQMCMRIETVWKVVLDLFEIIIYFFLVVCSEQMRMRIETV